MISEQVPGSNSEVPRQPRRFLSVALAAPVLDVSTVTLYRAIQAGQFPAIKIRGRYVIPAKVIDALEAAAVAAGSVVDAADWVDHTGGAR